LHYIFCFERGSSKSINSQIVSILTVAIVLKHAGCLCHFRRRCTSHRYVIGFILSFLKYSRTYSNMPRSNEDKRRHLRLTYHICVEEFWLVRIVLFIFRRLKLCTCVLISGKPGVWCVCSLKDSLSSCIKGHRSRSPCEFNVSDANVKIIDVT